MERTALDRAVFAAETRARPLTAEFGTDIFNIEGNFDLWANCLELTASAVSWARI